MDRTWRSMWLALCCVAALTLGACGGGSSDEDDGGGEDTGIDADVGDDTGTDVSIDVPGDTPGDTTNMCEGGTACERSRDCADAGLTNNICEDGCCVEQVQVCRAHLDECSSADQTTDTFICDTEAGVCLARCASDTADTTESEDCDRGSWCLPINGDPPETAPTLTGVCIPGDCDSIFDADACGGEGTCLPVGNNASFCVPSGTAGDGAECGQTVEGTECEDDTACGGDEFCSGGICTPLSDVCDAGLLCFQGECVTPCDRDNADCGGDECVAVFDNTVDNRPGVCGTACEDFSAGECADGEACTPVTGRFGLNESICIEIPTDDPGVGPGEECGDGIGVCGEGYVCANLGSEDEADNRCTQWCDPLDTTSGAFSDCLGGSTGDELIGATAYGEDAGYLSLAAGSYDVEVLADGALVAPLTVDVTDGDVDTLVATFDDMGDLDVIALTELGFADNAPPTDGVRAVHASADAGNVDAYLSVSWADALAFGDNTGWTSVPAGEYNLVVNADADGTEVVVAPGTNLAEGTAYTVVVHPTDTDPAAAVIAHDPTTSITAGSTGLRLFHAATAGNVDVYANCGTADACDAAAEVVTDFAQGESQPAMGYDVLPADTYNLFIFAAGDDPSTATPIVDGLAVTAAADTGYLIIAHDDGAGGLGAVVLEDDFAAGAGEVDVDFVHTVPGGPDVDVWAESTTALITDLAYGEALGGDMSAWAALDAGDYVVNLRGTDDPATDEPLYSTGGVAVSGLATLIFTGSVTDMTFEHLAFADDPMAPMAGDGHIRLIHAAAGGPTVTVNLPGEASNVCFPLAAEGLGFCIEGCAPYPRLGADGDYGCADGGSCRPFLPGGAGTAGDPEGVCLGLDFMYSDFESCDTNFGFECDDFGLCLDLDFDANEEPICMPLCEPLSEGQCPTDTVCSPLFPLFGNGDISHCDPNFSDGSVGDACTPVSAEGAPNPCEDDGTLCLDTGMGSFCTAVCRAGEDDCPMGTSCQSGVFSDPIPSFMGICQ